MKKYVLKRAQSTEPIIEAKDFSSELNAQQLKAVNFMEGPLLVIAGAGSGKTRTLVYRVARLVSMGIDPGSILLLTFTRKASQEMLRRATDILDHRCANVAGGTFHSFANIILRRFASYIGYGDNFSIMDRSDAEDLINHIRRDMGLNKADKRFPKKATIMSVISKSVNTQRAIKDVLTSEYPHYVNTITELETIAKKYEALKFQMQVMDYDDLLIKLRQLLLEHDIVQEKLSRHYQYIMVDEYQDTNAIQADLIVQLAGEKQNVMVVGDDSQSIYSFRGANFKNIMDFPSLFPTATVIKLEENYRSTQPILDITNTLISQAREKYTKHLYTNREKGDRPIYIETRSENDQSQFVAQHILELREEGVPLNRIAVLVRSGWHSNDLEVELKSRNIPFVKFGGFKFVETSHVKDVISFIRIIANPLDQISWQRLLLLFEGVGPKAASTLIELIVNRTGKFSDLDISKFQSKPCFTDLVKLFKILDTHTNKKPSDLVDKIVSFYKPLFKAKYDDHNKRQSDLDSLQGIAARFDTLETFLSEMSLEPPDSTQIDTLPEFEDEEKLTISTIHSAKGLEWHTVFILSLVDGYLPSFQSINDPSQIEEERRLLYVAMTRAETNLFLMKPNLDQGSSAYYRYPGMQLSKASRFLEEDDLIQKYSEKWVLVEEEGGNDFALPSDFDHDMPDYDPDRRKYNF